MNTPKINAVPLDDNDLEKPSCATCKKHPKNNKGQLLVDCAYMSFDINSDDEDCLCTMFEGKIQLKNTPKINPLPLNKKFIEITDDDFEIGENLKKLIEKTMIEILEKYYAKEKNNATNQC